jgi:hypothetical protein
VVVGGGAAMMFAALLTMRVRIAEPASGMAGQHA